MCFNRYSFGEHLILYLSVVLLFIICTDNILSWGVGGDFKTASLQDNLTAKSTPLFLRPHNLGVILSETEILSSALKLECWNVDKDFSLYTSY